MKIIVVIPAYNEAQKIFQIVRDVLAAGYDAVVVDDGSLDSTSFEAKRAGAKVLRHFVNRGYGAALTTGNVYAFKNGYDIAVHFDADGQHEVGDITRLIEPILSGQVEVVLGSRFKRDANDARQPEAGRPLAEMMRIPLIRKILLRTAVLFTWFVSGIKLTDVHNGLRAFSRLALEKTDCRQDGMTYASEIIDQIAEHNLRWQEAPVTIQYTEYSREKGESNIKKVLLGVRFLWERLIR